MLVAIDYDGTITADPSAWAIVVEALKNKGHDVVIVTMRHKHEPIEHDLGCQVFCTGRMAKANYMASIGIKPTVWIDDNPHWIHNDG